ncbi:hypothetical protein thalar_01072 [Litoreibacter arenae DSM 19593]|uniref:Uncharacterized protein n=2 Tax=Litoreibacter TaxID=947567 RepID=S9RS09_9RHOB|nr:hypothetical protein thalar_01072 [Litoreibacter arenae DSM 19593]
MEDEEVVTRMQALMVNLGSRSVDEKKGWFGRTKQTSAPLTGFTGKTMQARIAVFAYEVAYFNTEDEYWASTATQENSDDDQLTLGSTSFMPSGMFPDEQGQTSPLGFGVGSVKTCGTANSAFSGPDYHWAVVETLGGDFGVVWSPEEAGPAQEGGFLSYGGMLIAKWEKIENLDA